MSSGLVSSVTVAEVNTSTEANDIVTTGISINAASASRPGGTRQRGASSGRSSATWTIIKAAA